MDKFFDKLNEITDAARKGLYDSKPYLELIEIIDNDAQKHAQNVGDIQYELGVLHGKGVHGTSYDELKKLAVKRNQERALHNTKNIIEKMKGA